MRAMFSRTPIFFINKIIQTFNKMVFVSGLRRVGKATLAKTYQKEFGQSLYLIRKFDCFASIKSGWTLESHGGEQFSTALPSG